MVFSMVSGSCGARQGLPFPLVAVAHHQIFRDRLPRFFVRRWYFLPHTLQTMWEVNALVLIPGLAARPCLRRLASSIWTALKVR